MTLAIFAGTDNQRQTEDPGILGSRLSIRVSIVNRESLLTKSAMDSDWETAHEAVHDLVCSHVPFHTTLLQLKSMLLCYVSTDTSSTKVCEQFLKRLSPYRELRPTIQQFLVQVIYLLGIQSVVDVLYQLLIESVFSSQKLRICWPHLLALVSTVAVTVRGGIPVLKAFIRRLLTSVFHPDLPEENTGLTEDDTLNHIQDESTCGTLNEVVQPLQGSRPDWDCFCCGLLLARQLSMEDVRLTGFTYAQWWSETFCSVSHTGADSGAHILMSRADFSQLTEFLIELLPWESDPRLLQIQLNHKPVWSLSTGGHKQGTKTIALERTRIEDDDPLLLDTEVAMAEIESLDAHSINYCSQRWNDYVEIGRGRLAELRERQPDTNVTLSTKMAESSPPDIIESEPTPGWSEVYSWFEEISKQLDGDAAHAICRIPHSFTEAHLFQPRRLRSVLVPALLHAPEIDTLDEPLRTARVHLLDAIRKAGLGSLLEPFVEPIAPIGKRGAQQRVRPPRGGSVTIGTKRGARIKRTSTTTITVGRSKRQKH